MKPLTCLLALLATATLPAAVPVATSTSPAHATGTEHLVITGPGHLLAADPLLITGPATVQPGETFPITVSYAAHPGGAPLVGYYAQIHWSAGAFEPVWSPHPPLIEATFHSGSPGAWERAVATPEGADVAGLFLEVAQPQPLFGLLLRAAQQGTHTIALAWGELLYAPPGGDAHVIPVGAAYWTVTVIPEPRQVALLSAAFLLAWAGCRPRQRQA